MKKKVTFGTLIKRFLLIALGVFVVALVLVFIFDQYKPEEFNSTSKVNSDFAKNDDYTELIADGFKFYETYYNEVEKYNCNGSDTSEYEAFLKSELKAKSLYQYLELDESLFKEDGKWKNDVDAGILEMESNVNKLLEYAKYKEEVTRLLRSYTNFLTSLNKTILLLIPADQFATTYFGAEANEDQIVFRQKVDEKYYWNVNSILTTIETTEDALASELEITVNEDGYVLLDGVNSGALAKVSFKNVNKFFDEFGITATNAFEYASTLVEDLDEEDFIACFSSEKPQKAFDNLGFDFYQEISGNIKIGEEEDNEGNIVDVFRKINTGTVLAYYLYTDFITNGDDSYYSKANGHNTLLIQNLNKIKDSLTKITSDLSKSVQNNLLDFDTYKHKTLLGYEGLSNPSKTIKCDAEDGVNYYDLSFHAYSSAFRLRLIRKSDNKVLQTWYSNPIDVDPNATPEVKRNEQATFILYYVADKGQSIKFSSFDNAISDYNILNSSESLIPSFAFKIDEANNSLTVFYHLSKRAKDYTYFPKYISSVRMEEYLARNKKMVEEGVPGVQDIDNAYVYGVSAYNFLKGCYKESKVGVDPFMEFEFNYYSHVGNMALMSDNERNILDILLYQWCGYTEEDLKQDNEDFNQSIDLKKPEFEIAFEYKLTPDGLQVTMPSSYLRETEDYKISSVDILPYFTATERGIEGYTIIPDGSGEIMQHSNGNTAYASYNRRVYSTDLTKSSYVNQGDFNDLMFPMYGVVNKRDNGVNNSEALLAYSISNQASLELLADIDRTDMFNQNYYRVYLREYKDIVLGQAKYERKNLRKWTEDICAIDTIICYKLLAGNDLNYAEVAHAYRDVLIDLYDIDTSERVDKTNTPILDLDVIGAYTYDNNFVGIPYTAKDSLTTVEQLYDMVADLLGVGVKNMNVSYLGWRKGGLTDKSFEKLSVNRLIGSKTDFRKLLNEYGADNNVTVYPYLNFGEFSKYQESFGKFHYTAHAVDGSFAKRKPYNINSNIFDKTKGDIFALSPRYYLAFAGTLSDNLNKLTNDLSSVALRNLGNGLSGEYKRGLVTFKSDAMNAQIEALELLSNNISGNLTLYNPYDYAFKYASDAREIPYQGTQYEILDYSIPFYQLVCNGLFDYSGESINANAEKGLNEHIMRIIETGSNIAFTFTADSSEELLQTDYNNYYYTYYKNWLEDIRNIYNELTDLGIYECQLVNHERMDSNIYCVTYKNDSKTIKVYLNYTRNSYTAPDGTIVGAKSYKKAN